jgi:phytoene synthase
MNAATEKQIHFTPWHLRDRTRHLRETLSKVSQSNFFYSFLFLPAQKRQAIIDLYRFCREVDDIVDGIADHQHKATPETIRHAHQQLGAWRDELNNCYAGVPATDSSRRLRQVLDHFSMPKEYFEELITGCEMDLSQQRYETFADLYPYCYRVASITGLMCLEIFTYTSPRAREYAVNLGLALQLTNIIRDVREDAERGRIYLPREDLQRFGYSEGELMNGIVNDRFTELMKFQCERARDYYRQADECLPEEDRPTLVAARTMGNLYFRLLQQIEQVNYDVFHHRVRLHRPHRFLIALSEWAKETAVA